LLREYLLFQSRPNTPLLAAGMKGVNKVTFPLGKKIPRSSSSLSDLGVEDLLRLGASFFFEPEF
jgi:hypothetical protein